MKSTNLKYLFLLLAFGILSCGKNHEITPQEHQWLNDQDSLVVSLFPYYAPYQFKNKSGITDGVFVDYLELLEEKMNYKFKKVQYSKWSNVLKDVKTGKIDVVLEIQSTQDRANHLQFYELDFESPQTIVTRKGEVAGTKLSDYNGKNMTLPKDYAITEVIKANYPEINITEHEGDSLCLKLLNSGEYDAFVGPRAVVNHYKRVELLNNITTVSNTSYKYNPGIAVQKDNEMLNRIFKKATLLVTKKERQGIVRNWLFNEIKPFYATTEFWLKAFLFALFVLLCVGIFNRYLKFKVDQRTKDLLLATQKAEESNILKSQFIRNISHEIRTPLNGIIGFSELLLRKKISEEKRKTFTTNISKSASHLTEVVGTVQEVANLQSEKSSKTIDFIDIEALLEQIVSENITKAKKKSLTIKLLKNNYFPNAVVGLDGQRLKTALQQIIDNAIKFTEKGAVLLAYEITNDELKIIIKDTGIGITTNNEEVIFKSFAQLQHEISKKYSGLGLGLTIAREHIVIMGGNITYVSRIGEGSVFNVKLPYTPMTS